MKMTFFIYLKLLLVKGMNKREISSSIICLFSCFEYKSLLSLTFFFIAYTMEIINCSIWFLLCLDKTNL